MPRERIPSDEETSVQSPPAKKEVDDYDILREIENMFKTGPERESGIPGRPVPTGAESGRDKNIKGFPPKESVWTKSEHEKTRSEHMYQEFVKEPVKIDSKTEEQAKRFQALLERKTAEQKTSVNVLIQKIKNPATFREYILVSEILGKPKAFRR